MYEPFIKSALFFDYLAEGCAPELEQHIWFGLPAKLSFSKGCFQYIPINSNESEYKLQRLYSKDYKAYPVLKLPEELMPILDYKQLKIYREDSSEEVRHKLFKNNEKATFVIRQKARSFETNANILDAWNLVSSENIHIETQCYNSKGLKLGDPLWRSQDLIYYKHREIAAIAFLLSCIRSEILREDFRKRGIQFHPKYSFDNFMYSCEEANCNSSLNVIDISLLTTIYDLMNFLLCSYVHKEENPSSFIFLTWEDDSLLRLHGVESIYKYANQHLLRETLEKLCLCVSEFYSVVLQTEPKNYISKEFTDLMLIQTVFKMISKLESYAMNY